MEDQASVNAHPVVMFEFLADDPDALSTFYATVFGWTYETDAVGFRYVKFPTMTLSQLGGIGRASDEQGWAAGRNFYFAVDDLDEALGAVNAAGGTTWVEPTRADGYHFAMFRDPAGNVVGLLQQHTG
jgi:predicted enzyme related to lactoylglutathione lyase